MRAIAIGVALVGYGCGPPELATSAPGAGRTPPRGAASAVHASATATVPARPATTAPALRLPVGIAPVSYDITLELDPERDSFTGRVAIAIEVTAPGTRELWLHAVDLELASAALVIGGRAEPVAMLGADLPSQTRGFALPRAVGAVGGESIQLVIEYTGRATDLSPPNGEEPEGLFRQRAGGRWFLYSQAQSIFARKIAPCFDEPRWKPAWRVTAIVPRDLVALGNGPIASERALPDGRREVRFAEVAALPSYLLAVAVGPFDLVELGALGRGALPVRLAVARGDRAWIGSARRWIPKIIDALEAYFDAPLPAPKIDLVAVPEFFGAMENVGLITIDRDLLVSGRAMMPVVAHELAHQWFGNLVTPAWWDHLWLSEAFATWMEQRVAESFAEAPAPVSSRARALWADEQVDAEPLVHPIARSQDIEPAFSTTAYQKGARVLVAFERFVGADRFREAVRGYVAAHAGTSVISQAFVAALAAAATHEIGAALASNLSHPGTPVVDLSLRCGEPSTVIASARGGVTIPVCVRFPLGASASDRTCFLAGPRAEHRLPVKAGCPVWLVGNAGGRGYYQTAWLGAAPHPPVGVMSPEEQLARGDDAAAAVLRGELAIGNALVEIGALVARRNPYGQLAALAIARKIDRLVDDALQPAWAAWLAGRFRDRLTPSALSTPKSAIAEMLRSEVVALTVPAIDPATVAAARRAIGEGGLGAYELPLLRIAARRDGDSLFARILQAATAARQNWLRQRVLEGLGEFPAGYASRIVNVALDGRFRAADVWPALAAMLGRTDTRTSAWRAVRARLPELLDALPVARRRDVIAATAAQCDPGLRAEVAGAFAPRLTMIPDGEPALQRALGAIDRCIVRRAAAGDIAATLAATQHQ